MFVNRHLQTGFGVDGSIIATQYGNTLNKLGGVRQLPLIAQRAVGQSLSLMTTFMVVVVTHTRTGFHTQRVHRTVQQLATITGSKNRTTVVTVEAVA